MESRVGLEYLWSIALSTLNITIEKNAMDFIMHIYFKAMSSEPENTTFIIKDLLTHIFVRKFNSDEEFQSSFNLLKEFEGM